MSGVDALVGYDQGTEDKTDDIGLILSNVNLAVAIFNDQTSKRSWVATQASIGKVGFALPIDGFDVGVKDAALLINQKAADGSTIDFSKKNLNVAVGGEKFVKFDMKGERLQIAGNIDLNLLGFAKVSGGFAIEKSVQTVTLSDSKLVNANALTIGMSGVNAFVGYDNGTPETSDDKGLELKNVNLALGIFNDQKTGRTWVGAKGNVGSGRLLENIDSFEAGISKAVLVLNTAAKDTTTIDFSKTNLAVAVAPEKTVTLDMQGETIKVSGDVNLNAFNFVRVNGGFAFEKSTTKMTLGNGTSVNANVLGFGMSHVDIFAGLGYGTADQLGFSIQDTSLALALVSDAGNPTRQWMSLKADSKSVSFDGIEGVTVSAKNVHLALNRAAKDGSSIDYSKQNLKIGGSEDVVLDLAPNAFEVAGNLKLNLFDFVQLEGDFGFTKTDSTVSLSDGSKVDVDLMSLTAFNVNAFAGFGAGGNRIGFELKDVNLGLAFMSDKADVSRKWTSLNAQVGSAGFVGNDDLFIGGKNLNIQINKESRDGLVVDYKNNPLVLSSNSAAENNQSGSLKLTAGNAKTITLDMNGADGSFIAFAGDMQFKAFDFLNFESHLAFKLHTHTVVLSSGAEVMVTSLGFSKHDLSLFAGVSGFGFDLQDIDLNVALVTNGVDFWVSADATANKVAFKGIDGMTVKTEKVRLQLNTASNGTAIDYSVKGLTINKGSNEQFTFREMTGETFMISGYLEVNLFDFVTLKGDFAFQQTKKQVFLTNGSSIMANVVLFGGLDVNAFAGIASVGFNLKQTDFGFAFIEEVGNAAHQWTTLKAAIGEAGFTGIDGLDIAATDLNLNLNMGFKAFGIDYLKTKFDITLPDVPATTMPSLKLPKVDLPSIDLPSLDLPAVDLSGLKLPDIDLPTIEIPAIRLPEIKLPTLDLSKIKLPSLTLPSIQLPEIQLPDLDLSGIDFGKIDLKAVKLPAIRSLKIMDDF